jgi:hypothetical protein
VKNNKLETIKMPKEKAKTETSGTYKIIRTRSAGVFFVEKILSRADTNAGVSVVVANCRRLWYWDGAASLSQMAMEGVSKPKSCKFPIATDRQELLEVIEILDVTPEAEASIKAVPVWSA